MLGGLIDKPLQPQGTRQQIVGGDALVMEEPEPVARIHRHAVKVEQALDAAPSPRLIAAEWRL